MQRIESPANDRWLAHRWLELSAFYPSLLCLLAACLGCGDSGYAYAPVSGTVQINGQALAGVRVIFQPKAKDDEGGAGIGSFAVTNAEGQFVLRTNDGRPGAAVGDHRVRFSMYPVSKQGDPILQEALPSRFNSETQFSFVVPSDGTKVADFQLDAKDVDVRNLWQQEKDNRTTAAQFGD